MQLLGMRWIQHACIQLWQENWSQQLKYCPLLDEDTPQSHWNVRTRQEDQLSGGALHSHPDTAGKEVPQDSWGMVLDMWQTYFCFIPVPTPGLINTTFLVEVLQFTSASTASFLHVLESNFLKCKGPSFLQDLGERDRWMASPLCLTSSVPSWEVEGDKPFLRCSYQVAHHPCVVKTHQRVFYNSIMYPLRDCIS